MKNQKKARSVKGTAGKILIAAAIITALAVTASAAGLGWFQRYFEEKNEAPLNPAEVEYIEKNEQPIQQSQTQNGYTISVKSVITDGRIAYITMGITAPEDVVLSKTEIPGYSPDKPNIMPRDHFNGLFTPESGDARMGYMSLETAEDHDGLDNTQNWVLMTEVDCAEDSALPFAPGTVWNLHIEDLIATYHDLEAQKALDEKYGGGDYFSFIEQDGINPYPEVTLATGKWDFKIKFDDCDTRTVNLAEKPVTAKVSIAGQFINEPEGYENLEITSFVLSSLSATVSVDTDRIPTLEDYATNTSVYAVMKDGTQIELMGRSHSPGWEKLQAKSPINLDNVDHVILTDGTKLPMP